MKIPLIIVLNMANNGLGSVTIRFRNNGPLIITVSHSTVLQQKTQTNHIFITFEYIAFNSWGGVF